MNSDGSRGDYKFITTLPESEWEIAGTDSDFNKDGVSDIVVRNTKHGWTYVWLMKSDGSREKYNYITTLPSDIWEIVGTDNEFNRDGTSDLVVRKKDNGAVYVWLMKSDGTRKNFQYVTAIPASEWEIIQTKCDFDKDGTNDFVVRNRKDGTVYSWRMKNDGTRRNFSVIAKIPEERWSVIQVDNFMKNVKIDLNGYWSVLETWMSDEEYEDDEDNATNHIHVGETVYILQKEKNIRFTIKAPTYGTKETYFVTRYGKVDGKEITFYGPAVDDTQIKQFFSTWSIEANYDAMKNELFCRGSIDAGRMEYRCRGSLEGIVIKDANDTEKELDSVFVDVAGVAFKIR